MTLKQALEAAPRLVKAGIVAKLWIAGAAADGNRIQSGALFVPPDEIVSAGLADKDMIYYGSTDGGNSYDHDLQAEVLLLDRHTLSAYLSLAAMYGKSRESAIDNVLNMPGVMGAVSAALEKL